MVKSNQPREEKIEELTSLVPKIFAPKVPSSLVVAHHQLTLVHDNPERTIIEKIDTEQDTTVRQIRDYMRKHLKADRIELRDDDRVLNNDNDTLADCGWVPGECRTIVVSPTYTPPSSTSSPFSRTSSITAPSSLQMPSGMGGNLTVFN